MTSLFLGLLAGICFYGAVHHLQIAVHLRKRSPHILLAVSGVAFGILCLRFIHFYLPVEPQVIESMAKTGVPIGMLGMATLYWFIGLRAGVPRNLLIVATFALLVAVVINQIVPSGILLHKVTGFHNVDLPWGAVYRRPIIEPTLLKNWIFVPAGLAPVAILLYVILEKWRDRSLPEAGLLATLLFIGVLPPTLMLSFLSFGYVPVPMIGTGFTLTLVFLSLLTSHDVAQTVTLKEDLQQSEERFRRLVDTAPEAIALFDPGDDRCVGANHRAEKLLGRPESFIQGMRLEEFLRGTLQDAETVRQLVHELKKRAFDGETPVTEWELTRADGRTVPCELRFAALESDSSSLLRVSLLDISERKEDERTREEVETRLRQVEKLETLGTLAGGIAHDLNNMLTPIVGYGELALEVLEDHPAKASVSEMQAAAERARQLTRHILTFSRQVESPHEVFPIQPVVQQALRFLRATLPARIALVAELDAPNSNIEAGAAELNQIIMSLGTNAADAMNGEGRLHVSLKQFRGFVELTVADSGRGMDTATRQRILDPFFTTKKQGRASGLGLSVVHGIVTGARGTIDVESAPGRGATFRVRFPLARVT